MFVRKKRLITNFDKIEWITFQLSNIKLPKSFKS